jgi:two-component system cell cycle response regulator
VIAGEPFEATDGRRLNVTISVGVASLGPSAEGQVELVDRAGKACLQAKSKGKNQVMVVHW